MNIKGFKMSRPIDDETPEMLYTLMVAHLNKTDEIEKQLWVHIVNANGKISGTVGFLKWVAPLIIGNIVRFIRTIFWYLFHAFRVFGDLLFDLLAIIIFSIILYLRDG